MKESEDSGAEPAADEFMRSLLAPTRPLGGQRELGITAMAQ